MAAPNDSASGMDVGSETGPDNVLATPSATTMPGPGEDVVRTPLPGVDAVAISLPTPSEPRHNMPDPTTTSSTDGGSESGSEKEAASGTATPSPTIGKIRMLQEQLLELERERGATLQQKSLDNMEAVWDSQLETFGSEKAMEIWQSERDARARVYFQNNTAFALSKEYAARQETSLMHRLMEQGNVDEQRMQRRRRWEREHGITDPSAGKAAPQSSQPGVHLKDLFRDPPYWNTDEARFNTSGDAEPFDMQERSLRFQLTNVLREKHAAFERWKWFSEQRPFPPPVSHELWAKPGINLVKWIFFKYKTAKAGNWNERESLEDEFVIDVLDGEPDSTVREADVRSLRREVVAEKGKELKLGEAPQVDTPQVVRDSPQVVRDLPVPERIRVIGPQLQRALEHIQPRMVPIHPSSVILLRPFRILVYSETALRRRHEILRERFNTPGVLKDSKIGIEGTEERSTSRDLPHDDSRPERSEIGLEDGGSQDNPSEEEDHGLDDGDVDSQTDDDAKSQQSSRTSSTTDEREDVSISSPEAMEQLGCLVDFLDTYVLPRKEYLRGTECRRVHFRDLWYLFGPGDEVMRRDGKQIYRVIGTFNPPHKVSSPAMYYGLGDDSTSYQFRLECVYVDFDGKKLGPVRKTFLIRSFVGEKPVESLEVYPLRMHRTNTAMLFGQNENTQARPKYDWQTLRRSFVNRGRTFFQAACMKLDNTFYNGPTEKGDAIESQIVIDFEIALASDNNIGKHRSPLIQSLISGEVDDKPQPVRPEVKCYGHCCAGELVLDDSWVDQKRSAQYIESLLPKSYSGQPSVAIYPRNLADTTGDNALTDDEYILMAYRVFAFVLRTRQWAELDLTYVERDVNRDLDEDQEDSKTAFDHLLLPSGHKEIVQSLISQHFRNRDSGRGTIEHSDIVRGKGNGLILLLHGAPGVGKTSTAEGIAELFKKPLFTITCGDLGSTAKDVEKALDHNFHLANRWGCILLLDEADIFLTTRTETDFERNGLVAVFLRVLEYYAGILFLTTNRVGVIDEAFRSRIHISSHYPALNREQTEAVFNLNLKLIRKRFDKDKRKIRIESTDIIKSALEYFDQNPNARWNGRQIRNACQTALALAEFKAQGNSHKKILDADAEVHLAVENVQTVSKAYLDFTKYLRHLYGTSESKRAKELGLRAHESNRQHVPEQRFGAWGNAVQPGGPAPSQMFSNMPLSNLTPVQGHSYSSAPAPGQPAYTMHQPGVATYYGTNLAPADPAGNFVSYGNPLQAAAAPTYQVNPSFVMHPQPPQQPQQPQSSQGTTYPPQAQPWVGQANPANTAAPHASSSVTDHPSFQAHQPMQQHTGHATGAVHMSSAPPVNPQFQGGFQPSMQQQPQQQQPQQQPQQPEWPNFNIQALQSGVPGNQPGSSQ